MNTIENCPAMRFFQEIEKPFKLLRQKSHEGYFRDRENGGFYFELDILHQLNGIPCYESVVKWKSAFIVEDQRGFGLWNKYAKLVCEKAEETGTALISVANPFELRLDCDTLMERDRAFVEHVGYRLLDDGEGFKNKQARQRERLRELGFVNIKMMPILDEHRVTIEDCFVYIPAKASELIHAKFGEYFVRN